MVIPPELKEVFDQELITTLRNLPYRSFKLLKERIFKILDRLSEGESPKKNTCSEHWWFDYRKNNKEIGELWGGLLLEKTVKKGTTKSSKKMTQDRTPTNTTEASSPFDHAEMLMEASEDIQSTSTTLFPSYSETNVSLIQMLIEEAPVISSMEKEEKSYDGIVAHLDFDPFKE